MVSLDDSFGSNSDATWVLLRSVYFGAIENLFGLLVLARFFVDYRMTKSLDGVCAF